MNNTASSNMTQIMESLSQTLIQETYEFYILQSGLFGSLVLSLYPIILGLGQEIEYIWFKRFSLPALLYIFARYGALITAAFTIWNEFLPLGRTCDTLANVINVIGILVFIGFRGLLIARAYALCKGNKILTGLLALTFFSGLVLQVFDSIAFQGCATNVTICQPPDKVEANLTPQPIYHTVTQNSHLSDETVLVSFISNIINTISGLIEFGICWWNIWGTWRSGIKAGIRNRSDLVSIFLKQTISGILFGVTISIIGTVFQEVFSDDPTSDVLVVCENSLVIILVSNFILDLRQRNSAFIEASDISLPTLQIQSVLQHVHQSFLIEMGDQDENVNLEAGINDFDAPTGLPDDAGQSVEDLGPHCQSGTDHV